MKDYLWNRPQLVHQNCKYKNGSNTWHNTEGSLYQHNQGHINTRLMTVNHLQGYNGGIYSRSYPHRSYPQHTRSNTDNSFQGHNGHIYSRSYPHRSYPQHTRSNTNNHFQGHKSYNISKIHPQNSRSLANTQLHRHTKNISHSKLSSHQGYDNQSKLRTQVNIQQHKGNTNLKLNYPPTHTFQEQDQLKYIIFLKGYNNQLNRISNKLVHDKQDIIVLNYPPTQAFQEQDQLKYITFLKGYNDQHNRISNKPVHDKQKILALNVSHNSHTVPQQNIKPQNGQEHYVNETDLLLGNTQISNNTQKHTYQINTNKINIEIQGQMQKF